MRDRQLRVPAVALNHPAVEFSPTLEPAARHVGVNDPFGFLEVSRRSVNYYEPPHGWAKERVDVDAALEVFESLLVLADIVLRSGKPEA
jgi:hypothetical protein